MFDFYRTQYVRNLLVAVCPCQEQRDNVQRLYRPSAHGWAGGLVPATPQTPGQVLWPPLACRGDVLGQLHGLRGWGEDQHFSSRSTMGGQPWGDSHPRAGGTLADTPPVTLISLSKNPVLPVALGSGPSSTPDPWTDNTVSAWTAPQEGKKSKKCTDRPFDRAKNASRLQKLLGDTT